MRKNTILYMIYFLLLMGIWSYRYCTLNSYYRALADNNKCIYSMQETVLFGENFLEWQTQAQNCSICVDYFEIKNYDSFLSSYENGWEPLTAMDGNKVALVYITLQNNGDSPCNFWCSNLTLHSADAIFPLDWEALQVINQNIDMWTGTALDAGKTVHIILPYDIRKNDISNYVFNTIEQQEIFIRVTAYPMRKEITISQEEK